MKINKYKKTLIKIKRMPKQLTIKNWENFWIWKQSKVITYFKLNFSIDERK